MSATPTTASSSSRAAPPTKPSTSSGTSSSRSSSRETEAELPRRLVAVLNPRAGGGRCARRAPAVLARLRAAGLEVEVHETGRPEEATEIARQAFRRGARDFAALGGDGTAYELLNGLLPEALAPSQRCRLALLPLGTGNSTVQHFLEHDAAPPRGGTARALDALLTDRRRACDVLRLEHRGPDLYALGTVSLGFAAEIAHRVNESLKPLGVVGYTLGVLLELARLPVTPLKARLRLAGAESAIDRPAVFAAIQNVVFTGGNMRMAPSADPTDGVAELVTLARVGRFELLRAFPRIFRGDHVEHPAVDVHRFDRLELDRDTAQLVMLDGEVFELEPRRVEVMPRAIDLWI